jgi:hypothetical protein
VTVDVRFYPLFSNFCEHFVSMNRAAEDSQIMWPFASFRGRFSKPISIGIVGSRKSNRVATHTDYGGQLALMSRHKYVLLWNDRQNLLQLWVPLDQFWIEVFIDGLAEKILQFDSIHDRLRIGMVVHIGIGLFDDLLDRLERVAEFLYFSGGIKVIVAFVLVFMAPPLLPISPVSPEVIKRRDVGQLILAN